ncbi:hypothetical protein [Selenomonas sp. AE3005]|uniref:hypothetical protein n=1 Tax=Selenomonas sp. AE3005 TaxID=1485543 RepID=UPI000485F3CC|nr:hypothetical protein [Selenomonas sp. AE3005]
MGMARKMARFSRKAKEKAYLKEQQYNNELYGNINSVTEILKRCEPQFKADITEVLIRQMFAMSFMALHDEFGFGKERIMRYYKKMLSLHHELKLHGGAKPLDTLLVALRDEYKFDIDKAMIEANREFDKTKGE